MPISTLKTSTWNEIGTKYFGNTHDLQLGAFFPKTEVMEIQHVVKHQNVSCVVEMLICFGPLIVAPLEIAVPAFAATHLTRSLGVQSTVDAWGIFGLVDASTILKPAAQSHGRTCLHPSHLRYSQILNNQWASRSLHHTGADLVSQTNLKQTCFRTILENPGSRKSLDGLVGYFANFTCYRT